MTQIHPNIHRKALVDLNKIFYPQLDGLHNKIGIKITMCEDIQNEEEI